MHLSQKCPRTMNNKNKLVWGLESVERNSEMVGGQLGGWVDKARAAGGAKCGGEGKELVTKVE